MQNSENVPKLENVEVVLVHCNLVNNSYQQASRVLFNFVPNKQYHLIVFFLVLLYLFPHVLSPFI